MAERPVVALVRCDDYEQGRVEAAVRRAVDLLGGMGRYVSAGQRVALKPNLLRAMSPEQAATTHPAVLRAVIRMVHECGATAVIAESPGGPFTPAALKRVYEKTGVRQVAEETAAELNYDTAVVRVPNPEGGLLKLIDVIAPIAGADVVINLPKLKTHNLTRLSGATKNLFGVIPGMTKIGYHSKLQEAREFARGLVDIVRCVRPALTVVDAVVAMDGDGPSGGDPFAGCVLMASADAFAADIVAMALAGWEPLTMPMISVGQEWGLTSGRLADVDLRGDDLAGLRFAGFRAGSATAVDPGLVPRGILARVLRSHLAVRAADGRKAGAGEIAAGSFDAGSLPAFMRPWATRQLVVSPHAGPRCTGCRYCVQHCPVQAITVVDGRAHMDPDKCIRCYCCHELCPQLAVELKRPWLGRILFGA